MSSLPTQNNGYLTIVDIKDAHNPQILSTLRFPAVVDDTSKVAISDEYAFVTSRIGLHIIDISVPSQPVLIKHIPIQDETVQVQAKGDYVYVATNSGLCIVDVSMIENPKVILRNGPREYRNMPILDFRIQDDYMYVIDSYNYLHTLNISDPAVPKLSKSVAIPSSQGILLIRALEAEVEPVFVPTIFLSQKFQQMLRNPANIVGMRYPTSVELGILSGDKNLIVRSSNRYLCWHDRFGGNLMVRSLDTAPQHSQAHRFPLAPNYLKYFYLSGKEKLSDFGPVTDVIIHDSDAYLFSTDNAMHKADSEKSRFVMMTDFQISGDYIYATAEHNIFFVIDVSKTNNYKIISSIDSLLQSPIAISIAENYAYLLGKNRSSEAGSDEI